MNGSVVAELILEKDAFCMEKLQELKNLSRDEQIKFTQQRIKILWQIADRRKKVGDEIWDFIGFSREELFRYYERLSIETIILCHPVVGELYKAQYAFFTAFRPRNLN